MQRVAADLPIPWEGHGHEAGMVRGSSRDSRRFPFQIGGVVRGKSVSLASTTDQGASFWWRDRESKSGEPW